MVDKRRRKGSSDTSTEPTIASILGLSGPLRFRLHGSSQKAHIVLRRVQVPEDSGEDDKSIPGAPTTAFYSLFAHKRIEVKPGKEILLAIEGEFNDRAILIGGNLLGSGSESETQVEEGTEGGIQEKSLDVKIQVDVPAVADDDEKEQETLTMPPKMRKSWMRGRQSLPGPDIHREYRLLMLRVVKCG